MDDSEIYSLECRMIIDTRSVRIVGRVDWVRCVWRVWSHGSGCHRCADDSACCDCCTVTSTIAGTARVVTVATGVIDGSTICGATRCGAVIRCTAVAVGSRA